MSCYGCAESVRALDACVVVMLVCPAASCFVNLPDRTSVVVCRELDDDGFAYQISAALANQEQMQDDAGWPLAVIGWLPADGLSVPEPVVLHDAFNGEFVVELEPIAASGLASVSRATVMALPVLRAVACRPDASCGANQPWPRPGSLLVVDAWDDAVVGSTATLTSSEPLPDNVGSLLTFEYTQDDVAYHIEYLWSP